MNNQLFVAVQSKNWKIVNQSIQDGVNLDQIYKNAANFYESIVYATFSHKSSQMLQYLLENGVDIHHVFLERCTALEYAICYGAKTSIVKCLLKNRANPNRLVFYDDENRNVHSLYLALRQNWKYVFSLVRAGANVDFIDARGWSLVQWSAYYSCYALKIFIAAGADLDLTIGWHVDMVLKDLQIGNQLEVASFLFAADASFSKPINCFTVLDTVIYKLTKENDKFMAKSALDIREYLEENGMIAKARQELQKIKYQLMRERAVEVCIALQDLGLDANRMCFIVIEACAPFAYGLDFHYMWNLVVKIKHYN